MKPTSILTSLLYLNFTLGVPSDKRANGAFEMVPLDHPLDWFPREILFNDYGIETFYGHLKSFNATSWSQHAVDKCQSVGATRSVYSCASKLPE